MPQTDRLALPLLAAAQAQKEMTHNEALALLDIATQAVVQSVSPSTVPSSPSVGQCWIVGTGATGIWSGHDKAIACWTSGGWRFVPPLPDMQVWSIADGTHARFDSGTWVVGSVAAVRLEIGGQQVVGARQGAIAAPAGGSVVDTQARTAIAAILSTLSLHGLIAA